MGDFSIDTWIKYLITGVYINFLFFHFDVYDIWGDHWELFLATSLLVGVSFYFIFRTWAYGFIQRRIDWFNRKLGNPSVWGDRSKASCFISWLRANDCWEQYQEMHRHMFRGRYHTWRSSIIMFYVTGLSTIIIPLFQIDENFRFHWRFLFAGIFLIMTGLYSEWKYQMRLANIAFTIRTNLDGKRTSISWSDFKKAWEL